MKDAPDIKRPTKEKRASSFEVDRDILIHFGEPNPTFAYICGEGRTIAVDSFDERARRLLLRKGKRYYSKNSFFLYALHQEFDVDLYFDIGANYGECMMSLPKNSRTRVVGFEANGKLLPYLKDTLLRNPDLPGAEIKGLAVSSASGNVVTLYVDRVWSGQSSVLHDSDASRYEETQVKTTTIDSELQQYRVPDFFALKIDVEGYEPTVLEGFKNGYSQIPNVVCLIEFDENYLRKGRQSPASFFSHLLSRFSIFCLTNMELVAVSSWNELKKFDSTGKGLHVDLVLTKFESAETKRKFADEFIGRNLKEWATAVWKL